MLGPMRATEPLRAPVHTPVSTTCEYTAVTVIAADPRPPPHLCWHETSGMACHVAQSYAAHAWHEPRGMGPVAVPVIAPGGRKGGTVVHLGSSQKVSCRQLPSWKEREEGSG